MSGFVGPEELIERSHTSVMFSLQAQRIVDPRTQAFGAALGHCRVACLHELSVDRGR
jgi:hypothetical protein